MKMQKLSQIKPDKTMKDLATDETRMFLNLRAVVADESGVATTSRSCGTPQSISSRVGRAFDGGKSKQITPNQGKSNQIKPLFSQGEHASGPGGGAGAKKFLSKPAVVA